MKKTGMSLIVILMMVTIFAGCSSTKQTVASVATTDSKAAATDSKAASTDTKAATTDSKAATTDSKAATADDLDGDQLPNSVEKTYGTNPYAADTDGDKITDDVDDQPNFAEMPFTKDGSPMNVEIKDVRVEDNSTADHLEITFKNTGDKTLEGLDIYYTIEDSVANITEAYYQELTGVKLAQAKRQPFILIILQKRIISQET